jgi:NADPH-dependent 2,4-dienoyl-CoA reductase/sulfur reductase-like enzyme
VSWPNPVTGRNGRLETWTSANEQGAVAGANAVSQEADRKTYETVPYFWSDWYGNRIQFAGTATDADPEIVHGSVEEDKFVVLYRSGDAVVGALAVNEPSKIMKDRRKIRNGATWQEMLEHYRGLGAGAPNHAIQSVPAV